MFSPIQCIFQAKSEADERIATAEKKIKELSKQIHARYPCLLLILLILILIPTRKLLLDENTDKLLKNTSMTKRKEEATLQAREEIKMQTLREMVLKAEVGTALFRIQHLKYKYVLIHLEEQ